MTFDQSVANYQQLSIHLFSYFYSCFKYSTSRA